MAMDIERTLESSELYFSSELVDVQPAFAEYPWLLVGRTAASSSHFPKNKNAHGMRIITGAACGFDEQEVRQRAFAELIERVSAFCAGIERQGIVRCSFSMLQEKRKAALSPKALQQFALWQILPDDVPKDPDNAILSWCVGKDLYQGTQILTPALVAYLHWQPPCGEPVFVKPGATGLAAGSDVEAAQRRALLEVVERSTCMASWRTTQVSIRSLDACVIPQDYVDCCTCLGMVADLYTLQTAHLPATILALVSRPDGSCLTCGSACDLVSQRAIEKAIQEALILQRTLRLQSSSLCTPELPGTSFEHVVYAYIHGREVKDWYRTQASNMGNGHLECFDWTLSQLVASAYQAYQCPIVAVDVTDENIKKAGWSVFRAVIPTAYMRETDAAMPHLGGFTMGRKTLSVDDTESSIRIQPHPFG